MLKARSETEYETVQWSVEDSDEDEDSLDKLDPEDAEARQRWVDINERAYKKPYLVPVT